MLAASNKKFGDGYKEKNAISRSMAYKSREKINASRTVQGWRFKQPDWTLWLNSLIEHFDLSEAMLQDAVKVIPENDETREESVV